MDTTTLEPRETPPSVTFARLRDLGRMAGRQCPDLTRLIWGIVIILLVGVWQLPDCLGTPVRATADNPRHQITSIPKDILDRWKEARTGAHSGDPTVAGWISEGDQILKTIQQLDSSTAASKTKPARVHPLSHGGLRQTPDLSASIELGEIETLRLRFMELLKQVEWDKISHVTPGELRLLRTSYLAERERGMEAMSVQRKELIAGAEEFLKRAEGNEFLSRYPQRAEVMEDLLYRLAELYYQDAGSEFLKAFDQWNARADSARMGLIVAGAGENQPSGTPAEAPEPDYSRAEGIYLRILETYPNGRHVEDCLYDLAKIYEGNHDEQKRQVAVDYYRRLAEQFPESRYMPMVLMGIGDYHFYSGVEAEELATALNEACGAYQQVLGTGDSLMYDDAYFKIGWANYRMNRFAEAVEAFTKCIETTIALNYRIEPSEYTSFCDNSIRYLALLFSSKQWGQGGLDNAAKFVQENEARRDSYGEAVIHQMGDIQARLYEWAQAIAAYNLYLMFYPLNPSTVVVHEQKIDAIERAGQSAIAERDLFLSLYGPGSAWRNANPDCGCPADAGCCAKVDSAREQMLFSSTDEITTAAVKGGSTADLESAIVFCHRFLDTFPNSQRAGQVRMNLAMILFKAPISRYQEAFDQFMILAWSSQGDSLLRETAARNAVASAYAIMQAERHAPSSPVREEQRAEIFKNVTLRRACHSDFDSLFISWYSDLTVGEILYCEALDSYLCLFPAGSDAPDFLKRAGKLFFDRGKYAMSRYWLTKVEAQDISSPVDIEETDKMILNGLYTEQDYAGIEAYSKHVLSRPVLIGGDEFMKSVRVRMAEAIFKSAEGLRQSAEAPGIDAEQQKMLHQQAGLEYRRVAVEIPDFVYAHAALFNAGLEFAAAKDYQNAVESYQLLEENYPTSEYMDRALYNHAYLMATELKKPDLAAELYMRLFNEHPKSPLRSDALFNASRSYAEAGMTVQAIHANQTYAAAYPGTMEAKALLLDAAVLLGKQARLSQDQHGAAEAAEAYQQFARQYPNDPNVVRAHWERGNYLMAQGDTPGARQEFQAAVEAYKNLSQKNLEGMQAVKPLASKSLCTLLKWNIQAYQEVLLTPRAQVGAKMAEKKRLSEALVKGFDQLIAWSEAEAIWAMVQRAELLEEYAKSFRTQAPPADNDAIAQGEAQIQIARDAVGYQQLAIEEYLRVLTELPKTKAVLIERSQSAAASAEKRILDSLIASIDTQTDYCRNKSLDLRLSNADNLNATLLQSMNMVVHPHPESKKASTQTRQGGAPALRRQFTFWNNQLLPLTVEVVDLYRAAIVNADSSVGQGNSLDGKAREGASNAVKEYINFGQTLTRRTLQSYRETLMDYAQILPKGDKATLKGMEASDFASMGVDLSKKANIYAQATVQTGSDLIDRLRGFGKVVHPHFDRSITSSLEDQVAAFVVEYATLCEENGKDANEGLASSRTGVQLNSPTAVYEDAVFVFEQWTLVWSQYQLDILKMGYQFVEKFSIVSSDADNIRQKITTLDPKYLESVTTKPEQQ